NNLKRVALVKMDIEGYEPFVLAGMKQTMANLKPIVFVEILDHLLAKFNNTPDDVFAYFGEFGYAGYFILPNQKLRLLKKSISLDGLILFAPENDERIRSCIETG
ncbi:MAG: FkbM family methyltransferase, partial [Candidatus Paceibacterales bacterium]